MTVFSSIPFSRSSPRMCSMISCDIALLLLLVDQVAPDDLVVRDLDGVVARPDDDGPLTGAEDLPLEALALRRAERHLAPDRVAEVLRRADRALDPGRGDVDRILAQVLAQHVGDARAERVVDALGVIDEDGEAFGVRELDGEHLDAGQCRLDFPSDLLRQCPLLLVRCAHGYSLQLLLFNKNGRSAPISSSR